MAYFVSAHGGLPAQGATTQVPEGINFYLFCPKGQVLPDDAAWPIYNHLLAGDTTWANGKVVQKFFEGATMPNYVCWNYPEIQQASGVFKVGAVSANNPVVALTNYTEANPLLVSDLFTLLQNSPGGAGDVYWVACTA
jgi:hypothetical protein